MVNTKLAKEIVKQSGKKYKYIAQIMGITPYSLSKKLNNTTSMTTSEVNLFCEAVGINDEKIMFDIFFAK